MSRGAKTQVIPENSSFWAWWNEWCCMIHMFSQQNMYWVTALWQNLHQTLGRIQRGIRQSALGARAAETARRWGVCLPVRETPETRARSLGRENPLEKEMATCSRILVWEIPWTEEPETWGFNKLDTTYWLNNSPRSTPSLQRQAGKHTTAVQRVNWFLESLTGVGV